MKLVQVLRGIDPLAAPRIRTAWVLLAVASLSGLAANAESVEAPVAPRAALEVRFFPQHHIAPHRLDPTGDVASLLLQNIAVVNTGNAVITLERLAIEAWDGDDLVQSQPLAPATIAKLAHRSGLIAASGMLDAFAFHFRPERLLAGARVVGSSALGPGEALLVGHRVVVVQGPADRVQVRVVGRSGGSEVSAVGELEVVTTPPVVVSFPLQGTWFVGAGASFHSHHRWVVVEEFALDLLQLGEGGRSHRNQGLANSDYFAWDAEVRAVAGGVVAAVVDRYADAKPLLREANETSEAYNNRIRADQMALLATGPEAIAGNLVVVDHGNGSFSHYAHLRQGSVAVAVGDRVERGRVLGRLGNSGNSTEPHLHFQVSNGPDPLGAVALPFQFTDLEVLWADGPRSLQSGDIVVAAPQS